MNLFYAKAPENRNAAAVPLEVTQGTSKKITRRHASDRSRMLLLSSPRSTFLANSQ